jgi:AraC-like DNA-binding protein
MTGLPPFYRTHGKSYEADRCKPLTRAVGEGRVRLEALARKGYPGRALRPPDLPGVLSLGHWDAKGAQNWGLDWHRNEGIELAFLETGGVPFLVNRRKFHLEPGDLTITRPWQPHRVGDPCIGPGRLHWLILDVKVRRPHQKWRWPDWMVLTREDLNRLNTLLRQNEQPVWHGTPEIASCFMRISRAVRCHEKSNAISMLTVLLNELCVLVLEMLQRRRIPLNPDLTSRRRTVELFLEDLRGQKENLAEQWTLSSMAKNCGLGVTHFGNICKQITNMTPIQYLKYHRIQTASELLILEPERSITEIALSLGFGSSQYFATVFRRIKGASPREFRGSPRRLQKS